MVGRCIYLKKKVNNFLQFGQILLTESR
jgi:hypothetical protein